MNRLMSLVILLSVLVAGCLPIRQVVSRTVIGKEERNDLPRQESYSTMEYSCPYDWWNDEFDCGLYMVTKTSTHYDRAGYSIAIKICYDDGDCVTSDKEITLEEYRKIKVGDTLQ